MPLCQQGDKRCTYIEGVKVKPDKCLQLTFEIFDIEC